jgi:hypothetical protein
MELILLSVIVSGIACVELGFIYWWMLNKQPNMSGDSKNENEKDLERSNTGIFVVAGLLSCIPVANIISVILYTLLILFEILPTYGEQ